MISDFGLSRIEEDEGSLSTACGTPGYVGKLIPFLNIVSELTSRTQPNLNESARQNIKEVIKSS